MKERHRVSVMHSPACPCKRPGGAYADAPGPTLAATAYMATIEIVERRLPT